MSAVGTLPTLAGYRIHVRLSAGEQRQLGDILILKNGKRWEGKVSKGSEPDFVRIAVSDGTTLEFRREDVLKIKSAPTQIERFEERFKALRADREADLEAYEELARWAWRRELRSKATEVFRAILEIDPNHVEARRSLGYVVFRNRWVLEKTLKKKGELIKVDGEWMTPRERARRRLSDLRRKVASDFEGVDSVNREIQSYSFGELKSRCRDPRMREVLLDFLDHRSQAVRIVAVELLGFAYEKAKHPKVSRRPSARRISRKNDTGKKEATRNSESERELDRRIGQALLDRTLKERSELVRKVLAKVLIQLRHRVFFELALESVRTSPDAPSRERSAVGALYALRKAWVPELFQALGKPPPGVSEAGNPSVGGILRKIFKQDFAYDVKKWQEWWKRNAWRYTEDEG